MSTKAVTRKDEQNNTPQERSGGHMNGYATFTVGVVPGPAPTTNTERLPPMSARPAETRAPPRKLVPKALKNIA